MTGLVIVALILVNIGLTLIALCALGTIDDKLDDQ